MARTVFALLPHGAAFVFIGNPIPFTKDSDFVARGYQNGGSFIVSAIDQEFTTTAMVDELVRVDVTQPLMFKGNV